MENTEETSVGKYKIEVLYHGKSVALSAYRDEDGDTYVVTRHMHYYLGCTWHAVSTHLSEWERTEKIHRRIIGLDERTRYVPTRELDLLKKEIHSARDPVPLKRTARSRQEGPETGQETT